MTGMSVCSWRNLFSQRFVIPFPEELLIDFQEIRGAHSGANLANAVWQTIQLYGLEKKVDPTTLAFMQLTLEKLVAIIADNATDNDTLVRALEELFRKVGIPFVAKNARLRCMPHTTHLSALEVGICKLTDSNS
jgi:hypothetical protein